MKHQNSEIRWSYFHLGPLQGVLAFLPVIPVQTISIEGGIHVTIDAIQVGLATPVVPPCSVKLPGTVFVMVIIILIMSCKWLTVMPACVRGSHEQFLSKGNQETKHQTCYT